jgi:TrmH family RNA methyltransferase
MAEPSEPSGPTEPIAPVPASRGRLRSARSLLRAKGRSAERRFLVEGPQSVREALGWGRVHELVVADDQLDRHAALVSTAAGTGVPIWSTSAEELAGLSDTVTPQGVVAVADWVDVELVDALAGAPRLVVLCAQVRDPGNAGTVIRSADAFGADAVVLTAGSVDLHNPKAVRASVGSIFHLPIAVGADLSAAVAACRIAGLQVLAADGTGPDELDALAAAGDLARPTAWLMGNEAWGLPGSDRVLADRVVKVPIWGRAESLNLSTAAAVCLYATAAAQRGA